MSATVDPEAQKNALLGLFNTLWGDSEVGEQVRRRAKALNPALAIPDDNPVAVRAFKALGETNEKVAALEKLLADRDAADRQRGAESALREDLGRAQSRFKLTDDGLAGTIKLMQEKQISNAEAAAALYVDSLPKTSPSAASSVMPSNKLNLWGTTAKDADWEKLHVDPDGYFADVVNQVFTEMPVAS
jgi:hypothetical protein